MRYHGVLIASYRQRAHIVQAVSKLYDDNPYIVRHCDKHFADVFRLYLLAGDIRDFADFGNGVYKRCNIVAEVLSQLVERDRRILNNVMQQRRLNRLVVHAEIYQYHRAGSRMAVIPLARFAKLPLVSLLSEIIRTAQRIHIIIFSRFSHSALNVAEVVFLKRHYK